VNAQAGDYTADGTDNGKLIVMSKTTAKVLTLPVSPPSTTWAIFAQNTGAGALTIDRNALTIDGAASNLTLVQYDGIVLFTDGSNYFTERGISRVSLVAGKTGIVTLAATDVGMQVQATATIDAGTLASGASATGSIALCKLGALLQVIASAKSWLRIYQTAAGRDADAGRTYGTAPTQGCGLLLEIAWLGAAPLTYLLLGAPNLANGDGTPSSSVYWAAQNKEATSTHLTFGLTFDTTIA